MTAPSMTVVTRVTEDAGCMIAVVLAVIGAVLVVLGVLVLASVMSVGTAPWWVLVGVGLLLVLVGWWMRRGTPVV